MTTAIQSTVDSLGPWALFLHADVVGKSIIVLLLVASLVSWAITADKLLQFRRLHRLAGQWLASAGSHKSLEAFAQDADRQRDPIARVHDAVLGEWRTSHEQRLQQTESGRSGIKERLSRVAQIATGVEVEHLQRGLLVLATIGSVAPFVGLLGTVWGIMNSFQGIAASNDTSLTVVAPGIAEALFATALGLVAAIPAVIAYNRASRGLGAYASRLTTLVGLLEVHLSRSLEAGEDLKPAPQQPAAARVPAAHLNTLPAGLAAQGA